MRGEWGGYDSRLLKIIGLFCRRALQKRLYSAKETYNLKEPTDGSHPIAVYVTSVTYVTYVTYIFTCVTNIFTYITCVP